MKLNCKILVILITLGALAQAIADSMEHSNSTNINMSKPLEADDPGV